MSQRRSEALGLGLGLSRQHLALHSAGTTAALQDRPLAAEGDHLPGAAALQAALAALFDTPLAQPSVQRPGQRLTAVFASDLARHWLVQPPATVASLAEIRAVAHARFEAVHGCSTSGWLICGDWRSDGPFLCAAIPQGLADALASVAANQGLDLQLATSLGGALEVHADVLPDDGFLVLRLPEHQVLVGTQAGRVVALRGWRSRAGAPPGMPTAAGTWDEAVAELKREQLRRGQPLPSQLRGLDLSAEGLARSAPGDTAGLRIDTLASRLLAAPLPADTGKADAAQTAAALQAAAWPGALGEARLAARIGATLSRQGAGRWP